MNKPDSSVKVFQRNKIAIDLKIREIKWTERQREFIDTVLNKDAHLIFLKGPAGTSKTFLSMYCGLKLLQERRISDIVLVRPSVESTDSKLGFLPGDLEEKYSVYIAPFMDKMEELLPESQIRALEKDERLVPEPISFARGKHWAAKFIVADECQNFTLKELNTLTTRIGMFSKMIVAGDSEQSDLPNGKGQAFSKIYDWFNNEEAKKQGIFCFEMTDSDIMRSDLCGYIVKEFRKLKSNDVK